MLSLLVGGGVVYLLLGDLKEAVILLVFATTSVPITAVQEARTERVLEALRDLTSPRALVIRDGERTRIAGREVVRGDLVVLAEGDRAAAIPESDYRHARHRGSGPTRPRADGRPALRFAGAAGRSLARGTVEEGRMHWPDTSGPRSGPESIPPFSTRVPRSSGRRPLNPRRRGGVPRGRSF